MKETGGLPGLLFDERPSCAPCPMHRAQALSRTGAAAPGTGAPPNGRWEIPGATGQTNPEPQTRVG